MISSIYKFFMCALLLAGFVLALPADLRAEELSAAQKAEIQKLVQEYLLEHGEIVLQSVENYRMQEAKAEEEKAVELIKKNKAFLTSADSPSAGNPKGDVTIVEFFDYNCGYCKRAFTDIMEVVEADPNVRVVFKEMPILGPSSLLATQWALAAHQQGKYMEFHSALMKHRGEKDEKFMISLAERFKLDVEKMKKDINSPEVEEMISKDLAISSEIGVRGTPAFIVGDQFLPGYVGKDGLMEAIQSARENKS